VTKCASRTDRGGAEAGYDVCVVTDACGGETRESHDVAVLRMIQAGAVPNTTTAMITEWFRDWAGPLAPAARELMVPFIKDIAMVEDIYPRLETPKPLMRERLRRVRLRRRTPERTMTALAIGTKKLGRSLTMAADAGPVPTPATNVRILEDMRERSHE